MIDNFEKIKDFISKHGVLSENDFYFLQILKRRKDNPGMRKDVSVIDNFFLYSIDDLDKLKEKIINLCTLNNARACLRLNKRNAEKLSLQMLKEVTTCILNKDYKGVKSAYLSVCGQYPSDENKKWILDLDDKSKLDEVCEFVNSITTILDVIPTKNGFHIIVSPFNPNLFTNKYTDVEIKKDNPTILFIP